MSKMLMFNSDVVVGQHRHMLDLSLVFLGQGIAKPFLIAL